MDRKWISIALLGGVRVGGDGLDAHWRTSNWQ